MAADHLPGPVTGSGGPPAPSAPRWDAGLYAANTAHHRRHDGDFLRGVVLPPGARVLDLGCGVGDLTARLGQLATDGVVLGVDADPDMIATARARSQSSGLRFAVCRAQDLDRLVPDRSVDAVVSVAMLHWVPAADHPRVLAQIRRVLRRRGLFRAEFGGSGQIGAVHALLDEESTRHGGGRAGWFFPTPEQYEPLLADAGLSPRAGGWVRLVRQRRSLPDETAFLGWLRSQVLLAYDAVVPPERVRPFRRCAEERAVVELRRGDGSYDQDYVRLDLLAHPV